MATAVTTMWSLGVAKAYVTKNTAAGNAHDTAITQLADGVSSRIESFIRRKIVQRTVTEVLDGPNALGKIGLPDYPVSSVTSVKIRPSMNVPFTSVTALDASAIELDGKHGCIYILSGSGLGVLTPFEYGGRRTVQAVYVAGFDVQDGAAIPRDLYGMGLDYCKFLYARWTNDLIVSQNVSEGGKNITIPQDLPKDLRDAFAHYIKRRI